MAPTFITKRLASCVGTPVHTLTCGHTIYASFLHPTSSSKCAPNCKSVNMATNAEPNFLCPTCYASQFRDTHRRFMDKFRKEDVKSNASDIAKVLTDEMRNHDSGDEGENQEFNRWCLLELGHLKFEKAVSDSYKWRIEPGRVRGCKVAEPEATE